MPRKLLEQLMHPHRRQFRRAASMVEASVVLGVFLVLVLGLFDLGMAIFRCHLLEATAANLARQATVRGSLAAPAEQWGPTQVGPLAATAAHPIAQAVLPLLVGLDPAEVTVQADWPDGGHEREQRVRITLSATHHPLSLLLGLVDIPLEVSVTRIIVH